MSGSSSARGIRFIGDGWSKHELGTDEGAGVWVRGLASYSNADGSVTIFIAGSQGNLFTATIPGDFAGPGAISFTPVSRHGALGTIPAFKFFGGVSFGGADPGTLGFINGYHGMLLETADGGQTWHDLTDPSLTAPLQADIREVGLSPNATATGDGFTPVLVAASLNPAGAFYPPLHYGVIGSDGTITWTASAMTYDDGTTETPLAGSYYDLMAQALYLSPTVVLAAGEVVPTATEPNVYPLSLSTDGGKTFTTIPNFPQTPAASQVHELVADPTHAGIAWASGLDGLVYEVDLSSYISGGAGQAVITSLQVPTSDRLYGLAISPDDKTMVAVTEEGEVFWTTDPNGITADTPDLVWARAATQPAIAEAWSAQFVTPSTVVLIGLAKTPTILNGNTVETHDTNMVWVSSDAGNDWSAVNLDQDWATQQTALTGTISVSTSGGVNHLTDANGEIPISQGTLLLDDASLDVISATATATPALLLSPTSGAAGAVVDTQGNDLLLSSVLSGSGALVKTGAGTLELDPVRLFDPDFDPHDVYPANFQAGGVQITDGVVSISLDAELGIPNANFSSADYPEVIYPAQGAYALTLDGGTLQALQSLSLQTVYYGGTLTRPVLLGPDGGTFDTNGDQITLPGSITGAGELLETGGGVLVLDNVNTFAGGIAVNDGILSLQASGAAPAGSLLTVGAAGSVQLSGSAQSVNAIAGSDHGRIALQGGTLTIAQGAAGPALDFADQGGATVFATSDPSILITGLTSLILGFDPGEAVAFSGLPYNADDSPLFSSGTFSIQNSGTNVAVLHFDPTRSYNFSLQPGPGNTLVVTDLACFAEGTRIATPRGPVAVQDLAIGNTVLVAGGGVQPITAIRRRAVDCRAHPHPRAVLPVRVRAHTFGSHRPARDLLLSPDHAIFTQGVLIPVKHLINGDTIRQEPAGFIRYYHIRLPRHDILLAEGLPVESYFETGTRRPLDVAAVWEAEACAPLVVAGPVFEDVRKMLGAINARAPRARPPAPPHPRSSAEPAGSRHWPSAESCHGESCPTGSWASAARSAPP